MKKDFSDFEKSKDNIIKQIERKIGSRISRVSFEYFETMPERWMLYNGEGIIRMLFNEGEKYLLARYLREEYEWYLCSSEYAIIDTASEKVILTFNANDEG